MPSERPTNLWLAIGGSFVTTAAAIAVPVMLETDARVWHSLPLLLLLFFAVVLLALGAWVFFALFYGWWLPLTPAEKEAADVQKLASALTAIAARAEWQPQLPPDAAQRAQALLDEIKPLREQLLHARRRANQSGQLPPIVPSNISDPIKAWADRVVDLANECLSLEASSKVTGFPVILGGLVNYDTLLNFIDAKELFLVRTFTRAMEEQRG